MTGILARIRALAGAHPWTDNGDGTSTQRRRCGCVFLSDNATGNVIDVRGCVKHSFGINP